MTENSGFQQWVVLPSSVDNLLTIRPLSGTDSDSQVIAPALEAVPVTPASFAATAINYYDANFTPIGVSVPAGEYGRYLTPPPALPTSVRVGDTAVFATLTLYSSSAQTTVIGQQVYSYVIEPDTASTAIINLISRRFNTSNQLLLTGQSRYRITADGALTATSIDLQFSTTSTQRLVFTRP